MGLESRPVPALCSWENETQTSYRFLSRLYSAGNVSTGPCSKPFANVYTHMHMRYIGQRPCSEHCLDLGMQGAEGGPHGSLFLSSLCSKEKEERKLETFSLCIVSRQKDKPALGANEGPLRASALAQGVSLFDTPPPSPESSGTTPVGMVHEGLMVTHSEMPSDTPVQTHRSRLGLCASESPCSAEHAQHGVWSHIKSNRGLCSGVPGQDLSACANFPQGLQKTD